MTRALALSLLALLFAACDDATPDEPAAGGSGGGEGGEGGGGEGGAPGCGPRETPRGLDGACVPTGHVDCAAPLQPAPDGAGCAPIAAEVCAARERPSLGDPACRPSGPQSCPAGATLHEEGGCVFPSLQSCPGAQRRTLDGGCAPLGDCAGPFPPAAASIFVGATQVEDGATRFRSLSAALAVAPAGATIALDDGSHAGSFRISRPVTLVGRCAANVTLQGDAASGDPALLVDRAAPVQLRGLTLRGGEAGLEAAAGAEVTLEQVLVEGAELTGIFSLDEGTVVTLRESVVRDVRRQGGRFGVAASIGFGGRLVAEDAELSTFGDQGVYAVGAGSSASLDGTLVEGGTARPGGALGHGLQADDGASITATGSRVTNVSGVGALARGGGSVELTDVVIDGVAAGETVDGQVISTGALATEGAATMTLTRVSVIGTARDGVMALGDEVRLTAIDLALRGIGTEAANAPSSALHVSAGAFATVEGLLVDDVAGDGVFVEDGGTQLVLVRALVRRTRPTASPFTGTGLSARGGARLTIDDVTLLQTSSAAVVADDAAEVLGGGLLVRDVAAGNADPEGRYGLGLAAMVGGRLSLGPVAVRGATAVGALAQDGTLLLERAVIEATREDATGQYGYGVAAHLGGDAHLSDVTVREATRLGLFVEGGALEGARVTVVDTLVGAGTSGRALAVQTAGTLALLDAALLGSTQLSAFAYGGGALTLTGAFVGPAAKDAEGRYGHGLEIVGNATAALIGVAIVDQPAAGLVVADAAVTAAGCRFAGNAVALQAQDGVTIEERAALPAAPEARLLLVDPTSVFEANGSRVGAGALPLSTPVVAP